MPFLRLFAFPVNSWLLNHQDNPGWQILILVSLVSNYAHIIMLVMISCMKGSSWYHDWNHLLQYPCKPNQVCVIWKDSLPGFLHLYNFLKHNVLLFPLYIFITHPTMAYSKTAVTTLLTHWSQCSLALSPCYDTYTRHEIYTWCWVIVVI